MRIAIVDDKQEEREHLHTMIERYLASHSVTAEIVHFSSGEDILDNFNPGLYQCIFLDIYMDGIDGMNTAREIYRLDPSCKLIFATSSISHAVSSYEVRAAWYLTKPFSAKRLSDAMDATLLDIMHNSRSLTVHVNGTELNVKLGNIYFMDSSNRQARLHFRERTIVVDESVSNLLGYLSSDERFLMCNRNTLVNMEHIELVEDHDFKMKNNTYVPLRQRGRASLKKEYLSWTLRELRKEKHL